MLATLMRYVPDPMAVDSFGRTALHATCNGCGSSEAVSMMATIVPCSAADQSGMTALHAAALGGHADAVRVLIGMQVMHSELSCGATNY